MVEEGAAGNKYQPRMNTPLGKHLLPHLPICVPPCGLAGVWWLSVDSVTAVRRATLC